MRIMALGALPREGGQVVFFRPAGPVAGHADVSEGGRTVARLAAGSYVAVDVAPGTHTFAVDGRSLPLQVNAGERRSVRLADGGAGTQPAPSQAPRFLRASLAKR